VLLDDGHEGATYELATRTATVAELDQILGAVAGETGTVVVPD